MWIDHQIARQLFKTHALNVINAKRLKVITDYALDHGVTGPRKQRVRVDKRNVW